MGKSEHRSKHHDKKKSSSGPKSDAIAPREEEEPKKVSFDRKPSRMDDDRMDVDSEVDEDESESDDEDEDENGDLVTEKIDHGIEEVLAAIRSGSEKLKDKNFKFFPEVGAEGTAEAAGPVKREKPIYLKDYQRERVLDQMNGDSKKNEDDQANPESYAEEQARVRSELINEIHGDDEEEDDFLQKRTEERELPEIELPDPEQNEKGFLEAFLANKAWIPQKKEEHPAYEKITGDDNEDSDEFDDLSEKFENAYNFRYEDPNAAEIVSYARDQNTLRRGKKSSRQKKRDKERAEREKIEEQEKMELAKLRKSKVNEVAEKMAQLQEALGEGEENMAELLAKADLDADFDNDEWDKRMQKLFDESYYDREVQGEKPSKLGEEDLGTDVSEAVPEAYIEEAEPQRKLSKKELKRKAEQFVDENQDLLIDETIKPTAGFRYRTVEPETFGLTSRDILLASDKDLNQYVGIKKLASYRDKAKIEHDRKRYSKQKRLRQWRKEVFGKEDAPTDEQWEKAKLEEAQNAPAEQPKPKHKPKKRKHN